MARRRLDGARVIVTGASSGIGRALARQIVRRGADLVVTARRAERLEELRRELQSSGRRVEVVAGDIASHETRERIVAAANDRLGGLDILINNAGAGAVGPFVQASSERLRTIMEVNFFAPIELIRMALPLLQAGNRPAIVNIGSVLGHRAVPDKSEYCAAKFAMHGFSDALRVELAESAIDVILVSPSTTDSEFFDRLVERQEGGADSPGPAMSPDRVARRTLQAVVRGRHEVILSAGGRFLVWTDRLWPALADRLIARWYRRRPRPDDAR